MNVYPDKGWAIQDNQDYAEGTGALRIEYAENYAGDPTNDFQISWYTSTALDLRASTIGASEASISFWIWIGKDTPTSRVASIKFSTEYNIHEFEHVIPPLATYNIGWNQVIIPQTAFIESNTTSTTPDWSDINWIQIYAACYPDTTPTDILFDDLRLIEYIPPPPLLPPGVGQIDSFDDITEWSVCPSGVMAQGLVTGGDPVKKGTGSLIADYTPYSSDTYTFSKDVSPIFYSWCWL